MPSLSRYKRSHRNTALPLKHVFETWTLGSEPSRPSRLRCPAPPPSPCPPPQPCPAHQRCCLGLQLGRSKGPGFLCLQLEPWVGSARQGGMHGVPHRSSSSDFRELQNPDALKHLWGIYAGDGPPLFLTVIVSQVPFPRDFKKLNKLIHRAQIQDCLPTGNSYTPSQR